MGARVYRPAKAFALRGTRTSCILRGCGANANNATYEEVCAVACSEPGVCFGSNTHCRWAVGLFGAALTGDSGCRAWLSGAVSWSGGCEPRDRSVEAAVRQRELGRGDDGRAHDLGDGPVLQLRQVPGD